MVNAARKCRLRHFQKIVGTVIFAVAIQKSVNKSITVTLVIGADASHHARILTKIQKVFLPFMKNSIGNFVILF